MCDTASVLWTLGVLAAIEALVVLIFPKWTLGLCKKMAKLKIGKIRNIAWIELVIAIILGLLAYYL